MRGSAKDGPTERTTRHPGLVSLLCLADISERRMDVGHVKRIGRCDRTDGDAVAARDDQGIAIELERLHRERKKREQPTKAAVHEGRACRTIDRRRSGSAMREHGRQTRRIPREREEIRLGKYLAEDFGDALAAPHGRKPVVDDRHRLGHSCRRTLPRSAVRARVSRFAWTDGA